MRCGLAATVGAATLIVAPGLTSPALAATVAPYACPPDYGYSITSRSDEHIPAPGTYYTDGPGGTMTVSVTQASTITATGTVTAGATIEGIVAQAKVEVSASVSRSVQVTVGHTYSHNVSPSAYGHLQYGSWGYQVHWEYTRDNGNCSVTTLAAGIAHVPTDNVGWRYWE